MDNFIKTVLQVNKHVLSGLTFSSKRCSVYFLGGFLISNQWLRVHIYFYVNVYTKTSCKAFWENNL